MSYIGQQLPADVFSGYVTDTFTGDGSATTFTLSKAPFSADSLIVVVDNVIQQPTVNFTVSGTTLTIVGTAILSGIKGYAIHTGGPVAITQASKVDVNGLSDGVILDADADTTISADTDDQIDFKAGGTDVMSMTATGLTINDGTTITTADNTDTLSLISTDADANSGPNLLLDRNSSSTANQDALGAITFRGRNDAAQNVDYIKLEAVIADETDGTEDGNFHISNITAGTARKYISVNRQEICLNEDGANVDIRIEGQDGQFTTDEYLVYIDASAGRFSINSDGSPTVNFHCYNPHVDGYIAKFENVHTAAGQYGINVKFAASPDNNSQHAIVFEDSTTTRFKVWADGDVVNHDNSYGSTSDERIKEQIADASSQWDDIKSLKIRKYKMKDDVAKGDSDDHWRLGVIAQELESSGMSKLVKDETLYTENDPEVDAGLKEVGDQKDWKSVKYSVLYMKAIKALQEAMAKIETLETKVKALEDA